MGAPFHDGAIVDQTGAVFDDGGSIVTPGAATSRACRVQIDTVDDRDRPEGWTDKDYRFIVLSGSFQGEIDSDAQINVTDTKAPADFRGMWMVSGTQRDPAGIGWVGKGRRA